MADRSGRLARRALALALVLALAGGVARAAVPLVLAPIGEGEVLTLLLLGSDTGLSRGGTPLRARADAFHLLFVSGDRRHATLVNVPRDAWGPVPGRGSGRINACLVGGPDRCVRTVEARWGIRVDDYLLTSMEGWMEAVDALGGVVVDVPRPLSDGGTNITETGRQRLSGGQALTYGRDRKHRPDGDFDRTAGQAELLANLHRQLTSGPSVSDISRVLAVVRSHVITDLSAGDLLRYGLAAVRLPPRNVTSVTLPGSAGHAGAAAVDFLGGRADALVADAARDGIVG